MSLIPKFVARSFFISPLPLVNQAYFKLIQEKNQLSISSNNSIRNSLDGVDRNMIANETNEERDQLMGPEPPKVWSVYSRRGKHVFKGMEREDSVC